MSDRPPPPTRSDFEPSPLNPFANDRQVVAAPIGALANAEQQRSIAEVQARMIIARSNPRNRMQAMDEILRDCGRPSLAAAALYHYARGGSDISGPSIRLAEAMAQRWGNIASGIKELSRANGYSECVAYAWDLESGFYDERQYQVRHWRDTKGGGYPIKDERDIYELVANLGARRKRAVLLTVIPGDVVEAAQMACEETLRANVDRSPEALKRLVEAFSQFGVTQTQIEKRYQRKLEAIQTGQIVQLRKIWASLSDEMSTAAEWFEAPESGNGAGWSGVDAQHKAVTTQKTKAAEPNADVDTDGVIWDAAQHSANKSKNADGTWRVKRAAGTNRPDASSVPENDGPPSDRWEPPQDTQQNAPPRTANVARGQPTSGTDSGPAVSSTPAPADGPTHASSAGGQAFDGWLVDEHGEPSDPFDDPVAFARALAAMWERSTNRPTLIEQNADGIQDARAVNPEAAAILDTLGPSPAEGVPAEQQEPAGIVVVCLTTINGKPDVKSYREGFKTEVAALTAANYLDFIELNKPEMLKVPQSTMSLCLKDLVQHGAKIGLSVPPDLAPSLLKPKPPISSSAAPGTPGGAPSQGDQDATSVKNRISDLNGCQTLAELNSFASGLIMTRFAERMEREGKLELLKTVRDAGAQRRQELGG